MSHEELIKKVRDVITDVLQGFLDQKSADYVVHKGAGALQISLRPGSRASIHSSRGNYFGTDKGCIFLAIAPSSGKRSYDWSKKVVLKMNHTEIGKMILGLRGIPQDFYHDPAMGSQDQGKNKKILNISKSNNDKDVIYFNVSETKDDETRTLPGIAVDKAEAIEMTVLLKRALVRSLHW